MALPATIDLFYPQIAVSQTASIYGFELKPTNLYTFGYVEQVNPASIYHAVGDRVIYPYSVNDPVILIGDNQYSLVDERTILATEPPAA